MMTMKLHQKALDEIAAGLAATVYINQVVSVEKCGRNADVVGMAFEYFSSLNGIAELASYYDADKNVAADDAYAAYLIVSDLALGLMPTQSPHLVAIGDATGVTAVAASFEEQLDELRQQDAEWGEVTDYDETVRDASCRGQL